ncbi:MAG: hypothetical protein AAF386_10980 [Pseudomonadota bacterium]
MKRFIVIPFLALTTPAIADDDTPSLMEQGLDLFFQGLQAELEPALNDWHRMVDDLGPDLQLFLAEMGPALATLMDQVDNWAEYELPEIMPNGDIIIRKKQDPGVDATDL